MFWKNLCIIYQAGFNVRLFAEFFFRELKLGIRVIIIGEDAS